MISRMILELVCILTTFALAIADDQETSSLDEKISDSHVDIALFGLG